jgi:hypothetical protein
MSDDAPHTHALAAAVAKLPIGAVRLAAAIVWNLPEAGTPPADRERALDLLRARGDTSPSPASGLLLRVLAIMEGRVASMVPARLSPEWRTLQAIGMESAALAALSFRAHLVTLYSERLDREADAQLSAAARNYPGWF